jgi:hypothetical protein
MTPKYSRFFRNPLGMLLLFTCVLILTPFAVFPEIMGDIGPRNVPLWRNALGIVLLAVAALGIAGSLIGFFVGRKRRSS